MFVLPYYGRFAVVTACAVLIATLIMSIYKRFQKAEAVQQLDNFIPENLLITAVSLKEGDSLLATAVIEEAESEIVRAFELFKKRKKAYVNPKMLGGFVFLSALLVVLMIFPSEAQLEAGAIEEGKRND